MPAKIIAFAGPAGAGKDTAVDFLKCSYENRMKIDCFSFAGPLKEGVRKMWDFSDEQLYGDQKEVVDPRWNVTPREILQWMGTDVVRSKQPDHWLKLMETKIKNSTADLILISDVRFENERDLIMSLDGHVVKLVRPGFGSGEHSSEAIDFECNSQILNNGTLEQFCEKVDNLF